MSSEDLLAKFDEIVKRFKQEFNEIIEGERAKMTAAEVEANKAKKQRMKAFEVSDDDIKDLNVGGQKLTTTRSTLCQVEGSLLASMFSGRWEDGLKRDKDGAIFFDFNPHYFVIILDYLRAKKIATPENPASLPKVSEVQVKNFNNLAEYLGSSDEIVPTEILPSEKFNLRSAEVTPQEGGKVACNSVSDSWYGRGYVLGENVYKNGIISAFSEWPGSYGWVLGNEGGRVWQNGFHTLDYTLMHLAKQGDTVEMVLDCDAGKLSLHLPTGQQFQIDIPKSKTWRLNVTLYCANDKIRIMED